MITLTRMQRRALLRVWLRTQDEHNTVHLSVKAFHPNTKSFFHSSTLRSSYRALRAAVRPGPGCVMVPFAGMYLGIEPDGYTHS